jgi:hypothetical protein
MDRRVGRPPVFRRAPGWVPPDSRLGCRRGPGQGAISPLRDGTQPLARRYQGSWRGVRGWPDGRAGRRRPHRPGSTHSLHSLSRLPSRRIARLHAWCRGRGRPRGAGRRRGARSAPARQPLTTFLPLLGSRSRAGDCSPIASAAVCTPRRACRSPSRGAPQPDRNQREPSLASGASRFTRCAGWPPAGPGPQSGPGRRTASSSATAASATTARVGTSAPGATPADAGKQHPGPAARHHARPAPVTARAVRRRPGPAPARPPGTWS